MFNFSMIGEVGAASGKSKSLRQLVLFAQRVVVFGLKTLLYGIAVSPAWIDFLPNARPHGTPPSF
jgi:hypothetical protein